MKKTVMIFLVFTSIAVTGCLYYYYFFAENKDDFFTQNRPQLDIFLLIDHSGSMKGDKMDPIPSDPDAIRVSAAKYFVDYIQYFSDPKSKNRLSVINFGSDTPDQYQLPLTEMNTAENNKQIKEKIQEYSLGYTNFYQALVKVQEFYKKALIPGENRHPIVILFTDGEPKDNRHLTSAQYFEELSTYIDKHFKNISIEKTVRPVNFEFFVIALDDKGSYWPRDKAFWEKLAPQKNFQMKKANEEELENIYGKIIESLFTTQAGEWLDLEMGEEQKVIIPPYVEKVVISVKKDIRIKSQELQIKNPKGETLKEGEKLIASPTTGMTLYVLIEPEPGEWKLKLSPSGKVRIKSDLLPTMLDIKKPQHIHPLGEPFEITATFLNSDGSPVVPLSHYPLSFSATVKMPDGQVIHPKIIADDRQTGLYRCVESIPVNQDGHYDVSFEVNVGSFLETGNFALTQATVPVEVKPIVYFKSIEPSLSKNYEIYRLLSFWKKSPFVIKGKLFRNGKELPAQELSGQKVDEMVLAQVEKEKGAGVSNVDFLKYDIKTNSFDGVLHPDKHISRGFYSLFTRLSQSQADNAQSVREDDNPFEIVYGWGIICWAVVAYLIFYIILQILWRFVRAPLRGQLFINGNSISGRLSDFIFYNKARIVSRKNKFVIPWINTMKHDGDKNAANTCPTFYVIGDRHKSARGGRTESAVVVYYKMFHVIPWWTKLHQGRNTATVNGFSIRWIP